MDEIETQTAALSARFDALIEFLSETNAQAAAGHSVDLKDLDKTVAALCYDSEKSKPEVAKNIQPLMAIIITKLDELAQNLKDLKSK